MCVCVCICGMTICVAICAVEQAAGQAASSRFIQAVFYFILFIYYYNYYYQFFFFFTSRTTRCTLLVLICMKHGFIFFDQLDIKNNIFMFLYILPLSGYRKSIRKRYSKNIIIIVITGISLNDFGGFFLYVY